MKRITLIRSPQGWMADFGADDEIRALFGGSVLPTPYTLRTPAALVLAEIRRRNPDADVQLEVAQ